MKKLNPVPVLAACLTGILILASLSQCNPGLTYSTQNLRLDLGGLGAAISRDIATGADGTGVIGVSLVLSDAGGTEIASLDGSSGSSSADLDAGAWYHLEVSASLGIAGSGIEPRVWNWATDFQVPESGELTLNVRISRVSLDSTTLNLVTGDAGPGLTATVQGSRDPSPGLIWSSSDPSVVDVDSAGGLTALAPGSAVITALPDDNGFGATCLVTVSDPAATPTPSSSPEPTVSPTPAPGFTISFADPATPAFSGSGAFDLQSGMVEAQVAETFDQYVWYVNSVLVSAQTSQAFSLHWNASREVATDTWENYFVTGAYNQVTVWVRQANSTTDTADDEWYQAEFLVLVNYAGGS